MTPRIAIAMISTNSGSETERVGLAELKGSNDTVTKCRLATAKMMKISASGMTNRAVKNFRMTITRVDGALRAHARPARSTCA